MLKVIQKKRGEGKTTRLIYLSEFHNWPIITFSNNAAIHISDMAKHLGVDIPEPISIFQLEKLRGKHYSGVLIDDADITLGNLFRLPIKCIALTEDHDN